MRKPIVIGNWKLNLHREEARALIDELLRGPAHPWADVGVAPVLTLVEAVKTWANKSPLLVGAQNVFYEEKGAFTGECGPRFLAEAGASFCIVGHSERRTLFGETNDMVGKKVQALLKASLMPVACIGETLAQRKDGSLWDLLKAQLKAIASGIGSQSNPSNPSNQANPAMGICIAYEPIWAIGTGVTPTANEVEEVHAFLRATLAETLGKAFANETRILYGGSVTADNAKALMALPNVDGALVGGASLKAGSFSTIVASLSA